MDTKVLKSEVVLVTPEIAKLFLTKNSKGNRNLSKTRVDTLVNTLKRGEWVLSHQGIGFCENGDLLDGQHRLTAIVQSGIPAQLLITYGLPVNSFKVMDCGYKRSIADRSGLSRSVSESCSFFVKAGRGNLRRDAISVDDVMKVYDFIGEEIQSLLDFAPTMTKILTNAPCRCAAIVSGMKGSNEKEYAYNLYRSLSLGDTKNLPSIGHAIVRQVLNGTLITGGVDNQIIIYSRMRIVFDESNKDFNRVTISDSVVEKYLKELVDIFSPVLSKPTT